MVTTESTKINQDDQSKQFTKDEPSSTPNGVWKRPPNIPEHIKVWIVAAAIKSRDDKVFIKAPPASHHHIVYLMSEKGYTADDVFNQGFLTNENEFVDRKMAKAIALSAAQIKDFTQLSRSGDLFTEDLW